MAFVAPILTPLCLGNLTRHDFTTSSQIYAGGYICLQKMSENEEHCSKSLCCLTKNYALAREDKEREAIKTVSQMQVYSFPSTSTER